MAWFFLERIGGLLGKTGKSPNTAEVALAACALDDQPGGAGGGAGIGQELHLGILENRTAVFHGKKMLGFLPEQESLRVAGLLEKGVALGCRVIGAGSENSRIRVRISIRM